MAGAGPQGVDRRQAWYGPAYVQAICAQAGFVWTATASDSDVHSFDGAVAIHPGSAVHVQVKCRRKPFKSSCSYAIKPVWRANWEPLHLPAFFVVVVVPDDVSAWVKHETEPTRRTVHDTSAYWARIDPLAADQKSIQVTSTSRFTADTLSDWSDMYQKFADGLSGFTGGGS